MHNDGAEVPLVQVQALAADAVLHQLTDQAQDRVLDLVLVRHLVVDDSKLIVLHHLTTDKIPSTTTTRMSYRTSYRVGYRPSLSIHYYGNPYGYMGHMLYWYGGGYYAYTPGGPLMLGNPGMPGYQAAYGYDPGYNQQMGYAQQPVVVVQNGPGAMFLGMIALMVVVIIALIVGFIANN